MRTQNNPFNITKAVDYSDEELNKFWVDFPMDTGFSGIIKPTSDMPMIIVGGKGSGKTHIMKHFSFSSQTLRWKDDIIAGLKKDGYLGTYLRCSGLNGFKFKNNGEKDPENWQIIFSYYLELWLSQLLLKNIIKILEDRDLVISNEHTIALEILDLLDTTDVSQNVKSFNHLVKYFNDLQKDIDYAINNKAFTGKKVSESVEILASPGSLIFGIPEILNKEIQEFHDIKFLYLLDEYENFTKSQQKYFNTLIRERRNPVCFKIGARRYGIRTYETLSAGEEIKAGSEFEFFDIDSIFRDNKVGYKKFINDICSKRLELAGIKIGENEIGSYFETFNIDEFLIKIQTGTKGHLENLGRKLNGVKYRTIKLRVIENLKFEDDALLERINVMLFYREWKKGSDLLLASENIAIACSKYSLHKVENEHFRILQKFKYDILDALARENGEKIRTAIGFDNIIKISNGIPRHVLIIMKHIFKWNEYYELTTFKSIKSKISAESQLNAIRDTAKWFIEDARIPGDEGSIAKDSIERLCDYLRELRFSDIPPECSICTFSIKSKFVPSEISKIINFLEQYSYIIEVAERRDKNSNSRHSTYQLNGLLAVEWELSISRRGIVDLNSKEMKSIFSPDTENEFKTMLHAEINKYNAPFTDSTSPTLFDNF
ncbi:ORC-CDC6 family AAA ATPase [Flavobacterium anhuiense]|uniref:ORC-CDC6 family AAA ATPase n=1 Tax=Flavobacterium anhuiense TaxID=459526 RepID=UPI0034D96CBC